MSLKPTYFTFTVLSSCNLCLRASMVPIRTFRIKCNQKITLHHVQVHVPIKCNVAIEYPSQNYYIPIGTTKILLP